MKIKYRLIILFLAVSIIPMLFTGMILFSNIDNIFVTYNISESCIEEGLISKLENVKKLFLITTFIVSILVLIISYLIARSIYDPLEKISKDAQYISKGNFDNEIEIFKTGDEIEDLSEFLNKMVKILRKSTIDIEKKVSVRTMQLEKLNKSMVGRELKMVELKKEIQELKNLSR